MKIMAPISAGELIDKIAILSIKLQRIKDETKLANIREEFRLLVAVRDEELDATAKHVVKFAAKLTEVNDSLWQVLNEIEEHERNGNFGQRFIELARSVRCMNNRRCVLKREVDKLVGSTIVEEKSYV